MPLAALAGRRDVMQMSTQVFMTLTYGDEQLALAAALATLHVLRTHDVCGHIWRIGRRLVDGVKQVLDETGTPFAFRGVVAMPAFVATGQFAGNPLSDEEQNRAWYFLLSELAQRGIMWRKHSLILPSYSHSEEDIDRTLDAMGQVMSDLGNLLATGKLRKQVIPNDLPVSFKRL
jgi:glutamate-1-semialdehyde 2,1-aminomutase